MPSKRCPICRQVIPAGQEFRNHRQSHRREATERPGSTRRWRNLRELIIARDDGCVVCHTHEEIEVHHRDGDWRNDDPRNLETRCVAHHERGTQRVKGF